MAAHVICCNDSVEFVVLEDEVKAEEKLNELRNSYYEKNKWSFPDFESYKNRCYWHIHTVESI